MYSFHQAMKIDLPRIAMLISEEQYKSSDRALLLFENTMSQLNNPNALCVSIGQLNIDNAFVAVLRTGPAVVEKQVIGEIRTQSFQDRSFQGR